MTKHKLPKSIRRYIRAEKARVRRMVEDAKERERQIGELMKRFYATTVIPAPYRGTGQAPAGIQKIKHD